MSVTVEQFVQRYVAETADMAWDVHRRVDEPSGLDAAGMIAALGHPGLGRLGIPLMADLMAPEGSLYFDAIFGAFRGQADIRAWLLPAMAEIEFVDFVPTAEPVLFDDGEGGTSLDEWQMVANIADAKIPLSHGVSVRRYRDGWITWACDVYDTAAMRQEPPPEAGVEAAALPPCPQVVWAAHAGSWAGPLSEAARRWAESRAAARTQGGSTLVEQPSGLSPRELHDVLDGAGQADAELLADLLHPTDSVHRDPLVGELHGQAAIRSWLAELATKSGHLAYEPLGPSLFDGATSVQEWKRTAVLPDGRRVMAARGTTVRRYADGWLVSTADYFDTAPLADPDTLAALRAAGSTLTAEDVQRHRAGPDGFP